MTKVQELKPGYFGDLAADDSGASDQRPPLVFLHGLGFDRRHWAPTMRELAFVDPGRRAVSFDLPGHGASPPRDSYDVHDLATVVHDAVRKAGLEAPVVVGHSFGGALATVYAALYPARGVINVDQPLLVARFKAWLQQAEPVLRSPHYDEVWARLLAGMHVELLPPKMQAAVRDAPPPAQELLLGYWRELLVTPADELGERRTRELETLHSNAVPYHYVSGNELPCAYRHWLTSIFPDVTITVLPCTGHFPHLARPAALAKILAGSSGPSPSMVRAASAMIAAPGT